MEPYYFRTVRGELVLFEAATNGAIAPDGNPAYDEYLAWVAEGNTAPVLEDPVVVALIARLTTPPKAFPLAEALRLVWE